MNITAPSLPPLPAAGTAEPAAARHAAAGDQLGREFEAVLCSAMLKNALSRSSMAFTDADDSDRGGDVFSEYAWEQMAYHVGQQGVLGLSEAIGARLRETLETSRP